jgi:hypothetical protein
MKSTRTATPAREPDISEGEDMNIKLKELHAWIEQRREELRDKSFEAMNSQQFSGRMVGEMYAAQASIYEKVNDRIAEMIKNDK